MGIKGTRVINPGVTRQDFELKGKLVLEPAKKLARVPLSLLEKQHGFAFVLPHLLYDEGIHIDPVSVFLSQNRVELPCLYWDADYPLVTGLRRDNVKAMCTRIYALHFQDMLEILNCAQSNVFFNPITKAVSRLVYTKKQLLDFNAVKLTSPKSLAISVTTWNVQYPSNLVELIANESAHGITKSLKVLRKNTNATNLNSILKVFEDGEKDATQLVSKIDQETERFDRTECEQNYLGQGSDR
jgi:hypothetical protein